MPSGLVPLSVHYFVGRFGPDNDKLPPTVAPEAMAALVAHEWEGNVRELENVIERAVILSRDRIELRHLPGDLAGAGDRGVVVPGSTLAEIERDAILRTFASVGASTARTAEILGISVRKVRYKLKEYGVRD